jgi:hypothetical protein
MRLRTATPALMVAAALMLGGCDTPGSGRTSAPSPSPAEPWLRYAGGGPGARTSPTPAWTRTPATLPWTPLPSVPPCDIDWPADERVFIPMIVTPGAGSLTVRWPSRYGPTYRVAAVDQKLVTGTQPPPAWLTVGAGPGCTTTATLTGLIPGNPYVVWLDAPDTPRGRDNSRSFYSGRSAIVRPL